jgi:hypothetical protein
MRTVFIEGNSIHQKVGAEIARELANLRCASLSEAVDWLLQEPVPSRRE